jgi:hypothetical protein
MSKDPADQEEAARVLKELGSERAADLIERMGTILSVVSDNLEDEGDRIYFGSTNQAEMIRDLAQEWRDIRYAIA